MVSKEKSREYRSRYLARKEAKSVEDIKKEFCIVTKGCAVTELVIMDEALEAILKAVGQSSLDKKGNPRNDMHILIICKELGIVWTDGNTVDELVRKYYQNVRV